jgi:hypothetical protein
VRITSYPLETKAGMVWAYLGPQPAPLVPNWEPFTWPNGLVQIVFATIPCNWLQCQENSIDPVHFEWMHRNWTVRLGGDLGPYGKKHVRVGFDEFEYGFVYKRLVEGMAESHPRWQTGRICLWPNAFGPLRHCEDPKGIVRDPAVNDPGIPLPIIDREIYTTGVTKREIMNDPSLDPRRGYPLQAGQPEPVRRMWLEAMGFDPDASADLGAGFLVAAGAATSQRI